MDDVQRLLLEVINQDKIVQLTEALNQEKQAILALGEALDKGKISQVQYETQVKALGQSAVQVNAELKKLAGSRTNAGGGFLGASYGLQDFITVLSGGGGLSRALMSAANNISPVVLMLGGGAGLAGVIGLVVTAFSSAIPLIESFFGNLTGEAADKAKEKMKAVADEIKGIHEQFQKLANKPTSAEQQATAEITQFLGQRQHAEMTKEAIVKGMGRKSIEAELTREGKRDEWGQLGPAAEMSDAEIERQARVAAMQAGMSGAPGAGEAAAATVRRRLQDARDDARQKRFLLEKSAKQTAAERLLADAQKAGPEGAAAQRELLGRTKGAGGLEDLQQMTPEGVRGVREANSKWEQAEEREAKFQKTQADFKRLRKKLHQDDRANEKFELEAARDAETESQVKQAHFDKAAAAWNKTAPANEHEQARALVLQRQLANPMNFGNQRQENAVRQQLNRLQQQLGKDFPNLFNQTFENQARLNQILKNLERKGSRVAHEIRGAQQDGQTAMNMGAPF